MNNTQKQKSLSFLNESDADIENLPHKIKTYFKINIIGFLKLNVNGGLTDKEAETVLNEWLQSKDV